MNKRQKTGFGYTAGPQQNAEYGHPASPSGDPPSLTTIHLLPEEILSLIFQLLPLSSLAVTARVCCRWKAISDEFYKSRVESALGRKDGIKWCAIPVIGIPDDKTGFNFKFSNHDSILVKNRVYVLVERSDQTSGYFSNKISEGFACFDANSGVFIGYYPFDEDVYPPLVGDDEKRYNNKGSMHIEQFCVVNDCIYLDAEEFYFKLILKFDTLSYKWSSHKFGSVQQPDFANCGDIHMFPFDSKNITFIMFNDPLEKDGKPILEVRNIECDTFKISDCKMAVEIDILPTENSFIMSIDHRKVFIYGGWRTFEACIIEFDESCASLLSIQKVDVKNLHINGGLYPKRLRYGTKIGNRILFWEEAITLLKDGSILNDDDGLDDRIVSDLLYHQFEYYPFTLDVTGLISHKTVSWMKIGDGTNYYLPKKSLNNHAYFTGDKIIVPHLDDSDPISSYHLAEPPADDENEACKKFFYCCNI